MIRKEDTRFLIQLIKALEDAEIKLLKAYEKGDAEEFNRTKAFMIKIQKRVSEVIE